MKLLFSGYLLFSLWLWSACGPTDQQKALLEKQTANKQVPYSQSGKASYYSNALEGQRMASGDPYIRSEMTAAHNSLPLGTIIQVTNLANDSIVEVEITDRGPHAKGRILDLSRAAARQLGIIEEGEADIYLEVVTPAAGYTLGDSTDYKAMTN